MKQFAIFLAFVTVLTIGSSCKKKDSIVTLDPDIYVSIMGAGNINNTKVVTIDGTTAATVSRIALNALLTKAAENDIQAKIEVDTTLLRAYNNKLNTSFRLLPANVYKLDVPSNGVTILRGTDTSSTVATLELSGLAKLKNRIYILPIKISSISGDPAAKLSTPANQVFLQIVLTDVVQTTASITGADLVNATIDRLTSDYSTLSLFTFLNQPLDVNCTAQLQIDTSLIQSYNKANNVNARLLPKESYELTNLSVTVVAGQTQSSGSASFKLLPTAKLDSTLDYILPVRIQSVSGTNDVDLINHVVYIYVSYNNIDQTGAVLVGSPIDRTGWTAAQGAGEIVSTDPMAILDGDVFTDWYAYGVPSSITVDMKSNYTLKGIQYTPIYTFLAYGLDLSPTDGTLIYTSNDGVVWVKQGKYNGTAIDPNSSPFAPDIKSIKFFSSVNARYFRIVMKHSAAFDFYVGLSEVNALN